MKKALFLLSVITFTFTSCKKEYSCDCAIATNTLGITTNSTSSTSQGKLNKKDAADAKTACEAKSTSVNLFYISTTTSCKQVAK